MMNPQFGFYPLNVPPPSEQNNGADLWVETSTPEGKVVIVDVVVVDIVTVDVVVNVDFFNNVIINVSRNYNYNNNNNFCHNNINNVIINVSGNYNNDNNNCDYNNNNKQTGLLLPL